MNFWRMMRVARMSRRPMTSRRMMRSWSMSLMKSLMMTILRMTNKE